MKRDCMQRANVECSLEQWVSQLGPQLSASPGNLLELHILDPIPNLLHQRLWERSPVIDALISSLDDPSADQHLRHTGLEKFIRGEKKTTGGREGRTVKGRLWFPKWKRSF